jgi:hypothetical protein
MLWRKRKMGEGVASGGVEKGVGVGGDERMRMRLRMRVISMADPDGLFIYSSSTSFYVLVLNLSDNTPTSIDRVHRVIRYDVTIRRVVTPQHTVTHHIPQQTITITTTSQTQTRSQPRHHKHGVVQTLPWLAKTLLAPCLVVSILAPADNISFRGFWKCESSSVAGLVDFNIVLLGEG